MKQKERTSMQGTITSVTWVTAVAIVREKTMQLLKAYHSFIVSGHFHNDLVQARQTIIRVTRSLLKTLTAAIWKSSGCFIANAGKSGM
jgi:N-glycosylase/DNA lyase